MKNRSKVIKNENYHWESVETKAYKTQGTNFKDITRYSLLGEAEDEWELNSQTRYFEIQPGGYSSLEYHRHPHSVVIIRGKGSMVLGDEIHELGLHDVIFISPETLHQFHADKDDYLGFLCVVDRYRDKPAVPTQEMIDKNLANKPEVLNKCKI
jgi:quercetin dioxygenase-like cupin family protein